MNIWTVLDLCNLFSSWARGTGLTALYRADQPLSWSALGRDDVVIQARSPLPGSSCHVTSPSFRLGPAAQPRLWYREIGLKVAMSHPRLSGSGPRPSLEYDGRNTAGQARERNAPPPLRIRKYDWSPERYLWASDAAQSIIPAALQAQIANHSFKAKGGASRYLASPIFRLQPRRIVTRPGPVRLEAWLDVVENLTKTHLLVLNNSPMWRDHPSPHVLYSRANKATSPAQMGRVHIPSNLKPHCRSPFGDANGSELTCITTSTPKRIPIWFPNSGCTLMIFFRDLKNNL